MPKDFPHQNTNSWWKMSENEKMLKFSKDKNFFVNLEILNYLVIFRYNDGNGLAGVSSIKIHNVSFPPAGDETLIIFSKPKSNICVGICLFEGILATVWTDDFMKWKRINFVLHPSDITRLFTMSVAANSFEIVDSVQNMFHRFSVFQDRIMELNGSLQLINYNENTIKTSIIDPLKLYI